MASAGCWLLLGLCVSVSAQIYNFDKEVVPEAKSLNMLYVYFVFAKEDAPDKSRGDSYVQFQNLRLESTSKTATKKDLENYKGIQVHIMRYSDFEQQVSPSRMCATDEDVSMGLAKQRDSLIINRHADEGLKDVNVYRQQLQFGESHEVSTEQKVTKSGVYILVLSNCGSMGDAVLSGKVIVRNPHGYLPANEYDKLGFYAGLAIFYFVLFLGWLVLCVRWWKELLNFHISIGAVLFFGLTESILWYIFLVDWNSNGERTAFLFGSAVMLSVTRTTTSYMLVLVACLGWGVTRPILDSSLSCRIGCLSMVYIILNYVREIVISFRTSHSVPLAFIVLCLLPVSLMNGGIFYWVFSALTNLIETLEASGQTEKLSLFQKLWYILVLDIILAVLVMLVQVLAFSQNAAETWREQWLITDCAPHVLFGLVLLAMMYLWAPHEESSRYAYTTQIDGNEDGELGNAAAPDTAAASVWVDEADKDQDEESFWASTKKEPENDGQARADTIGKDGKSTKHETYGRL